MPRYPEPRRPRIDLGPLISAFSGSPELATPAADPNAANAASGAGAATNYPQFKRPGFFDRMVNPRISSDVARMNFESQLQQIQDQQALSRINAQADSQIKVDNNKYLMDSARNVLQRRGFTPEQIESIIQETGSEAVNRSKFARMQSEQDVMLGENEPEVLYGNTKAQLRAPGIANSNTEARTQAQQIDNQTLAPMNQANLDFLKSRNASLQQETQQRGLRFPHEQEILGNQAFQSQMIHLQPGGIYGNIPQSLPNGQRINFQGVMPAQRAEPGGPSFDFQSGTIINRPPTPASPPSMYNVDPSGVQPTSTPQSNNDIITVPQPDGTVKIYRKKSSGIVGQ
jgi:hypothetical protein